MSRPQSSVSSGATSGAPPPKANLSHPCFDCGLMFANKDDYQHHENVFHNVRDKITYTPCDECGKTFENTDELAEHQLEHDLAILVKTLCEAETTMAINRAQHQTSSSSIVPTKSNKNSTIKKKKYYKQTQTVPEQQQHFVVDVPPVVQQQNFVKKPKKEKEPPISKQLKPPPVVNVSSNNKRRSSEITLPSSSKKIKKDMLPPKKAPSLTEIAKDLLKEASFIEKAAASANLLRKQSNIPVVSAAAQSQQQLMIPPSQVLQAPTNNLRIPTPPIQLAQALPPVNQQDHTGGTVMLSSICPNCGENHGKPWSLIEHMIAKHGAMLVRLERKYTSAASNSVSEIFSGLRCNYCGLECDQLPSCLSHIVRMHREKLFECSISGECEVCFELMSSVGNEVTKRKFTIRVKVKRRMMNAPPVR